MALTEQQQRELDDAVREWQARFSPRRGYPASRKRIAPASVAGFKRVLSPEAQIAAAAASVNPLGGVFQVSQTVLAATTVVVVSQIVTVPFAIVGVTVASSVISLQGPTFKILVSKDSTTTGGNSTSGIAIDTPAGGSGNAIRFTNSAMSYSPNYLCQDVPAFIKCAIVNNLGAAIEVIVLVSLRQL